VRGSGGELRGERACGKKKIEKAVLSRGKCGDGKGGRPIKGGGRRKRKETWRRGEPPQQKEPGALPDMRGKRKSVAWGGGKARTTGGGGGEKVNLSVAAKEKIQGLSGREGIPNNARGKVGRGGVARLEVRRRRENLSRLEERGVRREARPRQKGGVEEKKPDYLHVQSDAEHRKITEVFRVGLGKGLRREF